MSKMIANLRAGLFAAGLFATAGVNAASAAEVRYTIQNASGQTITLDTSSCSDGAFISPSFSIANGGSATFSGTNSGPTTLCNVRYQKSNGGCQFQVQVSSVGGFASTNAYKGTATCSKLGEGSLGTSRYYGSFRIQ